MIVYKDYVFESVDIPDILYHGSNELFDKFALGKSSLGQNLNKYGHGIYLTDSIELAEYYSEGKSSYIYSCKIPRNLNLISWSDNVDESLYIGVANTLSKLGYESDSEQLLEDFQNYNETISADSLYNIVETIVGVDNVNNVFLKNGVDGFTADDISNRGKIYVILNPEFIRILNVDEK